MLSFITFEIYACVYLFYQEISINVISSTFFLLGNTLKDNLTYLVSTLNRYFRPLETKAI